MADSLTDFYDKLKTNLSQDRPAPASNLMNVSDGGATWRSQAVKERDKLKDGCCKRILLDIYCKVLPLDDDYIAGHQGQMSSDVDSFLASKNMNATQYLTSGYEKTNAPLLEFILRSADNIGGQFMKEADETLKDAKENNIKIPPPESDVDSQETQSQLVDVGKDEEYKTFIDKLKEKTIKKIVDDVSKIITDKKEENDMEFNPAPSNGVATESTISVGMDYINAKLWKEHVDMTPELQEQAIGLSIRESTLNELDITFKQPYSEFNNFASKIRFGKGVLINESAISYIKEAADNEVQKRYEPLYKETDGNKYDVANCEKVTSDGQRTKMTDSEAKKVLDPAAYKTYQSSNRAMAESAEFLANVDGMIENYVEHFNSTYEDAMFYYEDGSSSSGGIGNTIKNLIKRIKDFIMRIINPLLRKLRGATKAENKAAIISALASVNVNPAKKSDKFQEKLDRFSFFNERNGKHYFPAPPLIDLYYYKELLSKLREGKVPSIFKMGKNITDANKVKNISVEEYKDLAIEILDIILEIEPRITNKVELTERKRNDILNKLMMISNQVNMFLVNVSEQMKTQLDPLTEEALSQLTEMDKIAKFILQLHKESPNNSSLIRTCLQKICRYNNWKQGSGTVRFYIPDPSGSKCGYKFALSPKGFADNKRELMIWKRATGTPVQQYLIPIHSVSESGLVCKVAAATKIGATHGSALKKFVQEVDKASKNMNYTTDVMPQILGFIRLDFFENPNNVGVYNDHLVIIDYANSSYKFT